MDLWKHWPMRILALVIVLTATPLSLASDAAVAQQTGLKDMIYVSPTWGYTVRWYSTEWTVLDESSEAKKDLLTLEDTLGNVLSFAGTPDYAGDADACLDDLVAQVLATPGTADPETVESGGFLPFEWRDPRQSYTLMQIRWPVNGVLEDHAVYIECQTLVPGEAVLERLYAGPVAVFDQWYDDIVETIEGVYLPSSAWMAPGAEETGGQSISAGAAPLGETPRAVAALVPDSAGDPQLLVGVADAAGDIRVVTFENVSDAPVTVQPANLTLSLSGENSVGLAQQPYAVTWDDPSRADADGSRSLQPGERAEAQVAIAPIDLSTVACDPPPFVRLDYRQDDGSPVTLTASDVESCFDPETSAPAGGGRPKLRLSR